MSTISNFRKKGIVSLGTTLILGSIMVEIGLIVGLLVFFLNQANFNARLSAEALAFAEAGVQDAILRVVRQEYVSDAQYSLAPDISADVIICKGGSGSCLSLNPDIVQITSTGKSGTKERRLETLLEVNQATNLVKLISTIEVEIQ